MKKKLLTIITAASLLSFLHPITAQPITLGTASNFVLFTSNGAVGNTGITHLTGQVGSNSGSSTGFGNVDGTMHNNNGATGTASADLLIAYNQLNSAIATLFPAPLLGNGQVLNAGIYSISGNSTLSNTLTLDAQSNANAVFIIKIQGTFSSNANSKVVLLNGAKACNVYWKVEGLISLASGTSMKGNLVANNAAITISSGVTLEGRALSTTGALSVDNIHGYTPTGCGSATLSGPAAPAPGTTACYAVFSANGPVSNSGNTFANGDIGTNVGLTTGFNALNVSGTIHPIPDGSTGACATDLLVVYNYLNALASDIELLYPAQFGQSLVLTPHTYVLNGATTFVDTLFLNAENNANAVFVILVNGALTTSTYAKVALINGAKAANVYWKVEGAVDIADYSQFAGNILANNGAIDLGTGVFLNGRAHTTDGALATSGVTVTMPTTCNTTTTGVAPAITSISNSQSVCLGGSVSFTVAATGTNLTYQWRRNSTNMVNGGQISGATTKTLTINPAGAGDNSSSYNVVVSGDVSPAATSGNTGLEVKDCGSVPTGLNKQVGENATATFYPNPFTSVLTIHVSAATVENSSELKLYNVLGMDVMSRIITEPSTTIDTNLPAGFYFYSVTGKKGNVESGRLISN